MPRVLWVEDSPDDHLLMEFATEGTPLAGSIEVATDVQDGIARGLAAAHGGAAHAVVLVDLRLPGGDGWDVIAALRQELGTDSTCMVLSSSTDPHDVARTKKLGCEHLTKPGTLQEWQGLVERLLRVLDETG